MKILHISDFFPKLHKVWGGAEMSAARYIALTEENKSAEQALLCFEPDAEKPEFPNFEIFPVKRPDPANRMNSISGKILHRDSSLETEIRKILLKFKPDMIHVHRCELMGWSAAIPGFALNIPSVRTLYDASLFCLNASLYNYRGETCRNFYSTDCYKCLYGQPRPWFKQYRYVLHKNIIKKQANRFQKISVLSPGWLEYLDLLGVKKQKQAMIPLYIPEKAFEPVSRDHTESLILYVGWFFKHKGIMQLLQGFKKMAEHNPDVKLDAVDTGSETSFKQEVTAFIAENNLENRVSIYGRMPHEELGKLMARARLVALPEQWPNPFPVILTEAMQAGKLVAASRIGGLTELIGTDNERGFLVKHDDPDDWAKQLERGLELNQANEIRVSKAKNFILQYCGKENINNLLKEFYS